MKQGWRKTRSIKSSMPSRRTGARSPRRCFLNMLSGRERCLRFAAMALR